VVESGGGGGGGELGGGGGGGRAARFKMSDYGMGITGTGLSASLNG